MLAGAGSKWNVALPYCIFLPKLSFLFPDSVFCTDLTYFLPLAKRDVLAVVSDSNGCQSVLSLPIKKILTLRNVRLPGPLTLKKYEVLRLSTVVFISSTVIFIQQS